MWAIRMVWKPREMPKAINANIKEIPVTISAFSIGILVMPMMMVRGSGFMLLMAMDAAVPMMVAISADTKAMTRVLTSASMMVALSNICVYQRRVNPPHWVLDLELLKDRTIIVTIGAYKKIRIRTR